MIGNQVDAIINDDVKLSLINLRILVLSIQVDAIEELLNSEGLDPEDRCRALDAIKEYSETLASLKKQKARIERSQVKDTEKGVEKNDSESDCILEESGDRETPKRTR